MNIKLHPRVLVDYAPRRERFWGPWQFPSFGRDEAGRAMVSVSDAQDSFQGYGRNVRPPYYLNDTGDEWLLPEADARFHNLEQGLLLPSGDRLRLYSNVCAKHEEARNCPVQGEFTINKRHYTAYRACDLPVELGGLPLMRKKAGEREFLAEYAQIFEPMGLRCAADGLLPAWQARGMQLINAPDGSLLMLGYNFQMKEDETADPRDRVILFRSTDNGYHFAQYGVIPYQPDLSKDPGAMSDDRRGFLEPSLCFTSETHAVCVIRTHHRASGPLYVCHTYDGGKTFTRPAWLHDHGVLPRLLLLPCGVLALSFGRPGVDMLFSLDEGRTFDHRTAILSVTGPGFDRDSCGYTALRQVSDNALMIAYTDFRYDPGDGYPRKALFTRVIEIL